MKRYISISLSLLVVSLVNMLTWLCLGFTLGNPSLSSVFSLTYPIQFVVYVLLSIFGTGANVRKNKRRFKDDNIVFSSMIFGVLFSLVIFGVLSVFSDNYVLFMNMDVKVFGIFTRFFMLQSFAWFVFQLLLEKLYFEDKDKEANTHAILFYVLSFVCLIGCSLITKNEKIITGVSLAFLYIYTIVLFCLKIKKFKFKWDFYKNIKYDSVSLCSNVLFFITYFVGYSNAFEAGEKYVVAINLVNLVTDPQWDALGAIGKIAKIDLSRDDYNFKSAIKKSMILTMLYVASSTILFFSLYNTYGAVLWIGLICLLRQFVDMITDVFSQNLRCFLQLDFSATVATVLNLLIMGSRTLLSVVLMTPFNTNLAQGITGSLESVIYVLITARFYKLMKSGIFVPRKKKIKVDNIVLYVERQFRNLGKLAE